MEKYDPKKNYKWTPEDKFELDGNQFGQLLHAFRAILSTPEAETILRAEKANIVVEDLMKKYVEEGVIKEEVARAQEIKVPEMKLVPPDEESEKK